MRDMFSFANAIGGSPPLEMQPDKPSVRMSRPDVTANDEHFFAG